MNLLRRAREYVIGVEENKYEDRQMTDAPFGPRIIEEDGAASEQWRYGANRMADMACKVADELSWWYDEDEELFVVRNSVYDMQRREDDLWRAMWMLERDIRVEHGTKWHHRDERSEA